ncbi:hypothetical protein LCGC14_0907660 [marine sediment metagenome]|uniref:Uncharacterized protein n=1 Tax=marine sediment metagenome TaxID=412755 RepID=A0A0F9NZ80_9ZZZZ
MRVTRRWLEDAGACGPDLRRSIEEFGEEIEATTAVVTAARAVGIDVLWAGCHLLDEAGRREFVAFTLAQRETAMTALFGEIPPAAELPAKAREEWSRYEETAARPDRNRAVVLGEAARDAALSDPTAAQAHEAAAAARRAFSYAGLDEKEATDGQVSWLQQRLGIV